MTACQICATPYTTSGDPNCWCETGLPTVPRDIPVKAQPRTTQKRPVRLDIAELPDAMPASNVGTQLPHHATTTQQLTDLVDVVANLQLRLVTRTPGLEQIRTKRPAAEGAPVNVAVLHALDDRAKYGGDAMPDYLEEERWQCQHHSHKPEKCPHENDDSGRQGVLPDLWTWARMIEADLTAADPKLPEELPDPVTMATVSSWLVDHHERWGDLFPQDADEFAKDVRRWHNRLRAELGEHDPPTLRHTNVGGCGNVLAQLADGIRYECTGCHAVLTPAEMLGLARWQADVTLREGAAALGIKLDTAKQWVKRKRLDPVDGTRKPALFRLRDMRALSDRDMAQKRVP